MRKGNKRLTFADREKIEKMLKTGARVTEIAEAVGVHRATIYNEMKRGGEPGNKRLTFADREKIEKMLKTGARVTEIAEAVGVHRATIYNEMKRGGEPYRAEVAQRTI